MRAAANAWPAAWVPSLLAALAGCSTGEDNSLVSKTPFPEFSEADTEGNPVSSDIFADYDATIVNFWNNGCGTCIEEMPELEELYHQLHIIQGR